MRYQKQILILISISACLLFPCELQGQRDSLSGVRIIDYYLIENLPEKADSVLKNQIDALQNQRNYDSLAQYIYYFGKVVLKRDGGAEAESQTRSFYNKLLEQTTDKRSIYKANLSMADFYDELGENEKSLEVTKLALEAINSAPNSSPEEIGKVKYNIGATYLPLGKIAEAKSYFLDALYDFESYPKTSMKQLSDAYNAAGASMWLSSKLDSAKFYYNKAVDAISKAKGDPTENLYLGTIIKSNISLLSYSEGDLADAISNQKEVIHNYETVILNSVDENIVSKSIRFQNRAISNMAVFFNEQGQLSKARDMLNLSYSGNLKHLEASDITIGTSQIQLGQSYIGTKEFNKAIKTLNSGLDHFEKHGHKNPYWRAVAYHALADAYSGLNKLSDSKRNYELAESLFLESLGDEIDTEYLNFLRNKSTFLAKNGLAEEAVQTALKGYNYINSQDGGDGYSLVKQALNLAEVYNVISNFEESDRWIIKSETLLQKLSSDESNGADPVQMTFIQPRLILLKSKNKFYSYPDLSLDVLRQLSAQLDEITASLELRKSTVYKSEDINALIDEYRSYTDFSKEIAYQVYRKSKDLHDLDKILELHESGIYNLIRARLNLKYKFGFKDLPEQVLAREQKLRNSLGELMQNGKNDINGYLERETVWEQFKDSLAIAHPKYHKMRYGALKQSVSTLQSDLPPETTVIQYLSIGKDLFAFVIDKSSKSLIPLKGTVTENQIIMTFDSELPPKKYIANLNDLHAVLWNPLKPYLVNENICIIPEGQLFNLSFELLIPKSGDQDFNSIINESPLNNYNLSYNYSSLLVNKAIVNSEFEKDIVGFAPEFNDDMKSDYLITVTDSIALDKTYLTLLPQPFSVDLVKKSAKLYDGKEFINENATKSIFSREANEHKIIHIGTHAESNNLSPELSRLIFAKSANEDDNSLYTYEIYNQNLNANLAVLTACETGKPIYHPGEGMISLAHAFNYAGSESIVTTLWKIDEKASTRIIESFYNYLERGMTKDRALKKAKMDFVSSGPSEYSHPVYWAGLVLIGNNQPIELSRSMPWWIIFLSVAAILALSVFLWPKQNK